MSDPHTTSAPADAEPVDNIRWGLIYTSVLVFAAVMIGLLWWLTSIFTPPSLR